MNCQGNCKIHGGHSGAVRTVHVIGHGSNWGRFDYCDRAIQIDRESGFDVSDVEQPAPTPTGATETEK